MVYDPRADKTRRGVVLEPMALNVDIAPTILDLAGIPAPAGTQGCSLVPLRNSADRPASRPALRPAVRPADRQIPFLKGEKTKWRDDFLCGFWREFRGIPRSEGVRTEQWKYMRYFDQNPAYEELYDLSQDPHEERNLARDPGQAQTLDALRRRCDELLRQYGGVYPVPVTAVRGAGKKSGPRKPAVDNE
jgi:arylsulfatase A-like enzyme